MFSSLLGCSFACFSGNHSRLSYVPIKLSDEIALYYLCASTDCALSRSRMTEAWISTTCINIELDCITSLLPQQPHTTGLKTRAVLLAAVIPKLKELHDMFLNAYNVHLTVTPTTHLPAGPIAQVQPWVMYNGKLVDTFDAYGQTVFLGPPLGIPAISIPIGLSTDGLPLGIHFQARPGE